MKHYDPSSACAELVNLLNTLALMSVMPVPKPDKEARIIRLIRARCRQCLITKTNTPNYENIAIVERTGLVKIKPIEADGFGWTKILLITNMGQIPVAIGERYV